LPNRPPASLEEGVLSDLSGGEWARRTARQHAVSSRQARKSPIVTTGAPSAIRVLSPLRVANQTQSCANACRSCPHEAHLKSAIPSGRHANASVNSPSGRVLLPTPLAPMSWAGCHKWTTGPFSCHGRTLRPDVAEFLPRPGNPDSLRSGHEWTTSANHGQELVQPVVQREGANRTVSASACWTRKAADTRADKFPAFSLIPGPIRIKPGRLRGRLLPATITGHGDDCILPSEHGSAAVRGSLRV